MASYKLTYFDIRGFAEVSRLLFALAGQSYEDCRIDREETWPKLKPTTPFGQVPVLEIDGKPFAQRIALETYLAREFGFHGKSNLESLQVDQVVQLCVDLINTYIKVVYGTDASKQEEALKQFLEADVPKFLGHFEKLLKESGTGYFVGKSLTLADLEVYNYVSDMQGRHPGLCDSFPEVKALLGTVESNERLKVYLANRKPTDH